MAIILFVRCGPSSEFYGAYGYTDDDRKHVKEIEEQLLAVVYGLA